VADLRKQVEELKKQTAGGETGAETTEDSSEADALQKEIDRLSEFLSACYKLDPESEHTKKVAAELEGAKKRKVASKPLRTQVLGIERKLQSKRKSLESARNTLQEMEAGLADQRNLEASLLAEVSSLETEAAKLHQRALGGESVAVTGEAVAAKIVSLLPPGVQILPEGEQKLREVQRMVSELVAAAVTSAGPCSPPSRSVSVSAAGAVEAHGKLEPDAEDDMELDEEELEALCASFAPQSGSVAADDTALASGGRATVAVEGSEQRQELKRRVAAVARGIVGKKLKAMSSG